MVTHLLWDVWNVFPYIIPVIATGWVDCCGSRDRVQGGSCQPAVHGTGTSAQRNCTGRETTWEEVEGRRRSRVFHIDCTRLKGSVYRGEDNDSEIQSWKNTWIQLRTRHSMKTRFISLVFSFFFFQVEGFSRSLPCFKLNIAFECD